MSGLACPEGKITAVCYVACRTVCDAQKLRACPAARGLKPPKKGRVVYTRLFRPCR